jgi:hypothetical protein
MRVSLFVDGIVGSCRRPGRVARIGSDAEVRGASWLATAAVAGRAWGQAPKTAAATRRRAAVAA